PGFVFRRADEVEKARLRSRHVALGSLLVQRIELEQRVVVRALLELLDVFGGLLELHFQIGHGIPRNFAALLKSAALDRRFLIFVIEDDGAIAPSWTMATRRVNETFVHFALGNDTSAVLSYRPRVSARRNGLGERHDVLRDGRNGIHRPPSAG